MENEKVLRCVQVDYFGTDIARSQMLTSNVIKAHKFSHVTAFYMLRGKNVVLKFAIKVLGLSQYTGLFIYHYILHINTVLQYENWNTVYHNILHNQNTLQFAGKWSKNVGFCMQELWILLHFVHFKNKDNRKQ